MPHPHEATQGRGSAQSLFGFDPQSFLRDVPEATFQSFAKDDPFGKGPNQRRQFSNAFQDFQNRFLGESGSRAREGQAPRNFLDFLTEQFEQPDTGFSQAETECRRQSPAQLGNFSQFLNPRTRFLVNF